ncbi:unnamed protein product [Heligmosomoides polygyrus]|uniref:Uncharacterized protein n=1 Tax=Heligmosomoides polygyrus TaxID=6339 RepID=A0A183FWY3_HELPZ|nr:unnamed protein product [Heligmosomoides polygyrus]
METKMLRWAAGVNRMDAPIADKMREARLRWYGHVLREKEDSIPIASEIRSYSSAGAVVLVALVTLVALVASLYFKPATGATGATGATDGAQRTYSTLRPSLLSLLSLPSRV